MTDTGRYFAGRTHLAAADPHVRALIEQRPDYDPRAALSELPPMGPFGVLVFQIIGQQISVPATRAILGRVVEKFDGHLPTPTDILDVDEADLLTAGVSTRKAETIRALARLFVDRDLNDATFARMTDEDIERMLTEVPGVGPWTVQGFLVIALDRPDAFPAGDLAIRRAIRDLDGLDRIPSTSEARRRAEPWRPYRALAAGYLISWDAQRHDRDHPSGARTDD